MKRTWGKFLLKLVSWLFFNILPPLIPILLTLIFTDIRDGSAKQIALFRVSDLSLFSLIILAATKNDLDYNSDLVEHSAFYKFVSFFLLVVVVCGGGFFVLTYIFENIGDMNIKKEVLEGFSTKLAITASVVCSLLQIAIIATDSLKPKP